MKGPGRRRLGAAGVSVAGHGAAIALLALVQPQPAAMIEPQAMVVQLVPPAPPPPPLVEPPPLEPPPPEPEPDPAPKAKAPEKQAARPKLKVRAPRVPPPPSVPPLRAQTGSTSDSSLVSEAELAGAATVGGGSGGAGGGGASCDMTRRLQAALRRDRLVHAAVTEAGRGRAIRVWNGAWVRHGTQEGEGLAAVREAILWEVGFAPEACRLERMRGLVALSLGDGPGASRIVLGDADWRWADLLGVRGRMRSGGG